VVAAGTALEIVEPNPQMDERVTEAQTTQARGGPGGVLE
jgi:hypothetical protein